MRGTTRAAVVGLSVLLPATLVGRVTPAAADTPPYTVTAGDLQAAGLGPNHDQTCDVVYDLYVPDSASPTSTVPAILTTNGFGGSKADQASVADLFARNGYEVLSYSGLGFGGSSCSIELDSPEWDGMAAKDLVDFLGNRPEVTSKGPDNPVVGTWGGSYGGGFQFALAAVDPRVDAMIPQITWNDLSYSLAPNNDEASRIYPGSDPPGAPKFEWTNLFFGLGVAQPALNRQKSGNPPTGCPGFDQQVCVANAETAAAGYPTADVVTLLQHASAQYELFDNPNAHVPPMLLMQGQNDTLFNFNDALANYYGAKARGADVKLVFKEGGHSGGAAKGEVNDSDPSKGYLDQMYLNWYAKYLKHQAVDTGPEVEYFQDWVQYDTSGSAQPAYASASSYAALPTQTLYLSGGGPGAGGDLVGDPATIQAGSQSFVNPPNGLPASYSETSEAGQLAAPTDPPGEFASWSTPPLAQDTDIVGVPTLDFTVSAPAASSADPSTELVLFGKLYDVDASGKATLVHGIVSPLRIADATKPVHVNLPGQVHRYAAGHRIELVLASTDSAYVGSRVPQAITVAADPAHPAVLTLPVDPQSVTGPGPSVPEVGRAAGLPLVAAPVGLLMAMRWRRRQRGRRVPATG
jgi:predicted acyl esterase